jgi:hypothetical protein
LGSREWTRVHDAKTLYLLADAPRIRGNGTGHQ